ncbi:MAG: histidinol-phosphate transaminase [Pseudomonadota bacterium]
MISPVPHIARMSPYAIANLVAPEGVPITSLAQNESLRGPSPAASAAAAAALSRAHLYPDANWADLRAALAARHGLDPGSLLCAAGSLDLIAALARAYAGPDRAVLTAVHAYPFFRTAAEAVGARCDAAPEDGLTMSVDALLDAVRPDTRLVFVANPANPTGTRVPGAELRRLRDGLPAHTLLVIDEAYGEFADTLQEPLFDLPARGDTCILRTFSKAYGLAGLRVGWGVFPRPIAEQMRKVLPPGGVSGPALAAATAAVADRTYLDETVRLTVTARDALVCHLRSAGYPVPDSHTNFVLVPCGSPARARALQTALQAQGLVPRAQGGAGLPDALRLTIAEGDALDRAATILTDLAAVATP